jgi:Fur family zinc uptake transcriptional regulator
VIEHSDQSSKLAPNHAKVFDALRQAGRPMTAYEIIDAVRPDGISAPPTVYRALNRLIELGLAHRLESLNAFVACAHEEHHFGSTVFMICRTCGETREVVDRALDKHLRQTSSQCGFHVEQATIELRGHCAHCSDKSGATEARS